MSDFSFEENDDDDMNGNFSLEEYTEQERHHAEPAFITPEPPPPKPQIVDQLASGAKKLFEASESVDSNGEYLKISEDELKVRAKMQTKTIIAYIETGVIFFNSILILRKGDNITFENYETELKKIQQEGEQVEIDPESELSKVIERIGRYKKSEKQSKVDEIEEKLLYDAILADLKTQNNAKMLARLSKWEAVRDIFLSKVAPNVQDKLLVGFQSVINKF